MQQNIYEFFIISFFTCQLPNSEVISDTTERGIGLEKDSALYQLMDTRMNGIVNSDEEYQAILRESDIYLSKEIRLLIDCYVSEQNTHSSLCY